jgi:bacillithiol system protein YtxJ
MINWLSLEKEQQLDEIIQLSNDVHVDAVAIFKHSTRCSISSMAKNRLERSWDASKINIPFYYLDLLSFRQLSNEVANRFDIIHESPQLLLIQKGELKAHASHSAISAAIIEEL